MSGSGKFFIVKYYTSDGDALCLNAVFEDSEEAQNAANASDKIPDGAEYEIEAVTHPELSRDEMREKLKEIFT